VLEILYQDEALVAVHKPAGLFVHRPPQEPDATAALQLVRDQIERYLYPVHRLDRPTSGVLLFALTPEAARHLGQAFRERRVEKTYLAVVRGHPEPEGCIDHPLAKPGQTTPRPARTRYRRLATAELPYAVGPYPTSRYALLEVQPETGRFHQIRRHLNRIAHPIIGDYKHGDYRHNRSFKEHLDSHRLLLAAVRLTVPHPCTGAPLTVDAPLEDSFWQVVERLAWTDAVPAPWRRRG